MMKTTMKETTMKIDSRWLSHRDRTAMALLLRCAADLLCAGQASPGACTTEAQRRLGLSVGFQLVAYRLMKHAAQVWRNVDLANADNVRYLSTERVIDVHVWAALFAATRLEEGDWP